MKKIWVVVVILASMFIVIGCGGEVPQEGQKNGNNTEQKSLIVYSGAGLRKPMDEIGQIYEDKFGVRINYSYAGSAQNLSQIELVQEGDLYMPGALQYIESAEEKGYIKVKSNVVYHIPAIGVPKGNAADIHTLADLAKPGVKVILGDERSAAIGAVSQKLLEKNNILEEVEKNVVAKDATVNEVVAHIAMGQGDACIIWEDNIIDMPELEAIEIPEEDNLIKTIPLGVLSFTNQPELAEDFLNFVTSNEGKAVFEKHGFKSVE